MCHSENMYSAHKKLQTTRKTFSTYTSTIYKPSSLYSFSSKFKFMFSICFCFFLFTLSLRITEEGEKGKSLAQEKQSKSRMAKSS